jgi:hypothetical protein
MKTCAYCGRENDDTVEACVECGTENFQQLREPHVLPGDSAKAATLKEISSDPVRLFRALLLVSAGTFVITYFESYWHDPFLSRGSRNLIEWDGYRRALIIPSGVFHLQAILFAGSLLGLFWFVRSARFLYISLLAAFVTECLLGGMRVLTPLGGFFGYAGTLVDGMILLMACTVPLKTRFA